MAKADLTAQRLRELLNYNAETGVFVWLLPTSFRVSKGGQAGATQKIGYVIIGIDGTRHYAHRLAWFYVHGVWPGGVIDHIDGNKANNAIANLRDVSMETNMQNMRHQPRTAATGLIGSWFDKGKKRFASNIRVSGRTVRLGRFDTAEEAHAAYLEAKRRLHEGCTI